MKVMKSTVGASFAFLVSAAALALGTGGLLLACWVNAQGEFSPPTGTTGRPSGSDYKRNVMVAEAPEPPAPARFTWKYVSPEKENGISAYTVTDNQTGAAYLALRDNYKGGVAIIKLEKRTEWP